MSRELSVRRGEWEEGVWKGNSGERGEGQQGVWATGIERARSRKGVQGVACVRACVPCVRACVRVWERVGALWCGALARRTGGAGAATSAAVCVCERAWCVQVKHGTMGIQGAIADWLDGPEGATNKKLMKNLFIFGVAVAVLYNWEVVIGDFDEPPPAA